MTTTTWQRKPTAEYRYWLHDPEGDGVTYFRDKVERDAAAKEAVAQYLDSDIGWSEDVEYVAIGELTHIVDVPNKKMRPDDLDDEQCDCDGTYWSDYEWMGNYEAVAL